MRELLRNSWKFFLAIFLAGLALRLLFLFTASRVTDDSRIYADIAKNWLEHGVYGVSGAGQIIPTYIRLPGYPAFLAAIFAIFGVNNFRAVLLCQIAVDLATCFVIADIARRSLSNQAAKIAFVLAALCPFLANYAAAVLTETLEIFFTALALDFAIAGVDDLPRGRLRPWVGCGLAIAACIYLRPDGGLLLVAIGLYLLFLVVNFVRSRRPVRPLIWAALLVAIVSLGPLVPWTVRNLRTMHRFEPLTPRYATEPDEYVPMGFNHWIKTWVADYASVEEVYWQEPGAEINANNLPNRAFDSAEQKRRTSELIGQYNETTEIDPDLDKRFEELARERIRAHPFRYYVFLPLVRIADMWLRPRTELLPADVRWWEFNDDVKWSAVAVTLGAINLLFIILAVMGAWRARSTRWLGILVLFVLIRSVFLATLENPEPRYTLECYPVVIVLAAAALEARLSSQRYGNVNE